MPTLLRLLLPALLAGCDGIRALVIENYPSDYAPEAAAGTGAQAAGRGLQGAFDGPDAGRAQLALRLSPVVEGLQEPTDIQFPPGRSDRMVVLEKGGAARIFEMPDGEAAGVLLRRTVLTRSEEGLLGLAFHPDFARNGKLYINHVVEKDGKDTTRISELSVDPAAIRWEAGKERVLLEVEQPFANHDAGQLAFGPDGYLYIGLGDGGWRDDPKGNGQNATTLLGSMLRIDVDQAGAGLPYGIPADNPFLGQAGIPPETWAIGLRNPWRYSFDPQGRLVVADVGQNSWEEIDLVSAGDNLGWNIREGRACFPADASCAGPEAGGYQDPIHVYGRAEGSSVTGGLVYQGSRIPALQGRYVFGDFVSGRIWALDLPPGDPPLNPPAAAVTALGHFPLLISSFGRDGAGELYVADYQAGTIYRLDPPAP